MPEYTLCNHTEVPDLVSQLTELSNLAFGDYEGAMEMSEEWMTWYLQRPGTDPERSQAALCDGQMVSNVLVALQPLQIGGQLLRCGIIDSVATHPDHRRQGLARALMGHAHLALMGEADAAVLYTNPADHPYQFYQRLGYQTRAYASLLAGPRPPAKGVAPSEITPQEAGQPLFDLLNDFFAEHEGYCPMDEDLWAWHKCDRPGAMPVTVVIEGSPERPTATATFAEAELLLGSERRLFSIAYDVAAQELTAENLASVLSAAPHDRVAMILDQRCPEYGLATEVGLEAAVSEVAMVLPLGAPAEQAIQEQAGPWYAMIESIIGV